MKRHASSRAHAIYTLVPLIIAFAFVPMSVIATTPHPKEGTSDRPEPVMPTYTTKCVKNHTDNETKKLFPCWEAPVEVHVVFIENDGVHSRVTHPPNVSVTFDNDANLNWSKPSLLKWKMKSPTDVNTTKVTNDQGRVTTGFGFDRVPNPELGNQWLQNVTFNVTIDSIWNMSLKDKGYVQIPIKAVKNITIPNNETEELSTNYSRWFFFYYNWTITGWRLEVVDDHWEAGAGIVGFIIIAAVPTVWHFQRKKEVEESKRKEKEARFKI